ncbi:hypothetical protein C7377_1714 [Balneicella halophila]|uniref:DUF3078 family protein n=1 Tax=Balneicella halophila TaxID=1537566 RepID=A0A7L4UND2_BALHA|nr:DUF3078 domain-containing protein [Balneicella halophila]PVX50066.1 hypothetical protein C7377_1714 [Balneicella halophila]
MKKVFLTITAFILAVSVFGQEVKTDTIPDGWTYVANTAINISQTSFSNWSLGGEGSVGGIAVLNLGANYKQDRHTWDNSFVGQYGIQKIDGESSKKSIDMFDLNSKYGYQIAPKWSLAGLLGVKSQFANGYNYLDNGERSKISSFFAPGYVTTSVGFDYKPNTWFSALLSPLTGKYTFVADDELSDAGAFGVDPGDKFMAELGAMINAKMQKDIMKNVNLASTLTLFSAYTNNFGNIDVSWDVVLGMKVNKYISATISTSLLYDDDIDYINEKGVNEGPKVQFKEVIGVGFSYNFME